MECLLYTRYFAKYVTWMFLYNHREVLLQSHKCTLVLSQFIHEDTEAEKG